MRRGRFLSSLLLASLSRHNQPTPSERLPTWPRSRTPTGSAVDQEFVQILARFQMFLDPCRLAPASAPGLGRVFRVLILGRRLRMGTFRWHRARQLGKGVSFLARNRFDGIERFLAFSDLELRNGFCDVLLERLEFVQTELLKVDFGHTIPLNADVPVSLLEGSKAGHSVSKTMLGPVLLQVVTAADRRDVVQPALIRRRILKTW